MPRIRAASQPGPPPRYATVIAKAYPYSLRPVLIFTSILGLIWSLVMAVQQIQNRGNAYESSKQKTFDLIRGIMFFVVAGVELYALMCAVLQSLTFARLLIIFAPLGVGLHLAAQIMMVIAHFTLKSDLINQCYQNNVGTIVNNGDGTTTTITPDKATSYCTNSWSNGNWTVFAWFFVTLILSVFFWTIALAYYRQLVDPSSVRPRRGHNPNAQVQGQSIPLQPQHHQFYPPPPAPGYSGAPAGQPQGQQPWMVPPYPGPPADGQNPFVGGYEKSDYQPSAEWAAGLSGAPGANAGAGAGAQYGPPPGSPPRATARDGSTNREEEEAWAIAQSQGVTAHFTGHASPTSPRGATAGASPTAGCTIGNAEEDEAWERARTEGVTSHITGTTRPAREGAV